MATVFVWFSFHCLKTISDYTKINIPEEIKMTRTVKPGDVE